MEPTNFWGPEWARGSAVGCGLTHVNALIRMGDWCGSSRMAANRQHEATGANRDCNGIFCKEKGQVKNDSFFARGGVFSLDLTFNG